MVVMSERGSTLHFTGKQWGARRSMAGKILSFDSGFQVRLDEVAISRITLNMRW